MTRRSARLRQLIQPSSGNTLASLLCVTDLCVHFIDTEEKLATKVLGPEYLERWMKTVRRRLKDRKAREKHAG